MEKRYCSDDSNSHTHTHTKFEVEIETYCPMKKRQVLLILQSDHEQKGEIVEGKPVYCNWQFNGCEHVNAEQCLLNALRIETRRRI